MRFAAGASLPPVAAAAALASLGSTGFVSCLAGAAFAATRFACFENREHLSARHGRAVLNSQLFDDTGRWRRHFEHDFVGFEIDEVFIATDAFAWLLVPRHERRVGHRLRQLRNFDFDTHSRFLFERRVLMARAPDASPGLFD